VKDHFKNFQAIYGTPSSSITTAVEDKIVHGKALIQLGEDLKGHSARLAGHVRDDIAAIAHVPQHPANVSHQLGTHALYAAGCIKRLGAAAVHFDSVVADLNSTWVTIHMTPGTSGTPVDTPEHLTHRYHHARSRLEQVARSSARMLRHPGNLDNVKRLMDHGFIPVSAIAHWPALQAQMIKDINSGKITDPTIALGMDYRLFSPDGRNAVAEWAHNHLAELADMLRKGETVNLPAADTRYTYKITMVDEPNLKIWTDITIASGSGGIMALGMSGLQPGGTPKITGILSGKNNDTSSIATIDDGGWSGKVAHDDGHGTSVGLSIDKDGLWLTGDHTQSAGDLTVIEHAKVRPAGDYSPPEPEPEPVRVPNPFAPLTNLAHNVEHGVTHGLSEVGSGIKDAATAEGNKLKEGAENWGKWLEEQGKGIGPALRDPDSGPDLPTIPGIPIPIVPVVP